MKKIEIILTSRCNMKCIYCASTYGQGVKEFNAASVKKILTWAKKANVEGVYFGGGEPTVVERLDDLIHFAKALDYKVIRLLTNGILLEEEAYLKRLLEHGLNEVEISISSWNSKMSEALTGEKNIFERQLKGIKNVLALRMNLELTVLVTTQNYEELPKVIKLYSELGVKNFTFWLVSLFGIDAKNLAYLVPKITDIMPYLVQSFSAGRKGELNIRTLHIPVCFFDEPHRKHVLNVKDLDLLIIEPSGKFRLEDSPFEGGVKLNECLKCKENENCLGLRKDYLDIYGEGEVKAIM